MVILLESCHGSEVVCIQRFTDTLTDSDHWLNGQQLTIYELLNYKKQHTEHHRLYKHKWAN